MAGEWQDKIWGDIASLEYGKSLRGYEKAGGRYTVFGTNGPIGWHDEHLCPHATVVVGRKGAYRGVHYSPEPCYVIDTAFYLKPKVEFDMRWAYYELLTHDIDNMDSGSAIPSTSRDEFYQLPLRLPPLHEQRAIAHILGTLDDKIELNRRMNETLEAIARAIFKSWFVDFLPVRAKLAARTQAGDPVRLPAATAAQAGAKAEGRLPAGRQATPGLPKPLANLFPDSFEDSELGGVPSGWEVRRWGDVVTLEYGKSLSGYANGEGAYPVFGTNGKIGSHSEVLCNHPGIIVGRKGAYRGVHFCSSPFFVIDTAFFVEPKVNLELRWAYYELLRQDINSMDSGSAIPSTSREDFYSLRVLAPPHEIQQYFVNLMTPHWTRQEQNEQESRTLTTLRDTLLPKLLSGEVRVTSASGRSFGWEIRE